MQEILQILEKNENIHWEGKQDLRSTLLSSLFFAGAAFLFGAAFAWISGNSTSCEINGQPASPEQCAQMGQWVMYGSFLLAVMILLGAYLFYRVTHYCITSKRILIKSGIIGADFRSVYYDQVKSAFVDVGIIGKLFGTWTIRIDTWRIRHTKNGSAPDYDNLSNILQPYEVYRILQQCLASAKEGMHSGRSDFEHNSDKYKEFVQQTEQWKKEVGE